MEALKTAICRVSAALDRAASVVTVIALALLVGVVLLQVAARYVIKQPPAYTEELARYAMIWAGLIGATMSFRRRFDPALMNGMKAGPGWLRAAAEFIRSLTVLIYLAPILLFCFVGPNMNLSRGFLLRHSKTLAESMPFHTIWIAIAVPIMIVIIFVHVLARWCGDDGDSNAASD
ncbi:MAG: TRAP transporter small permease [Pikeienuella sp.]